MYQRVGAEQPVDFFEHAIGDMDSKLVATSGCCMQGMDVAYHGTWGYHALQGKHPQAPRRGP